MSTSKDLQYLFFYDIIVSMPKGVTCAFYYGIYFSQVVDTLIKGKYYTSG